MKHVQSLTLCALVLSGTVAITQASEAPKPPSQSSDKQRESREDQSARGQKVFAENCSRCHNAPQGFSSHISGTIAKHMRQRALLSDDDYKALLHFLNAK